MPYQKSTRHNLFLDRQGNQNEWEPKRLRELGDFLVSMGLVEGRPPRRELRQLIREILREVYQSHHVEPQVGDLVVNVNPDCKHHGSEGVVLSINDLPGDSGKTISYMCSNDGATWDPGDLLEKTMDQ